MLLTTHYLHEAEALCDRIAVLADGEIRVNDTTNALLRRVEEDRVLTVEFALPFALVPDALRRFSPATAEPRHLVFRYKRGVMLLIKYSGPSMMPAYEWRTSARTNRTLKRSLLTC